MSSNKEHENSISLKRRGQPANAAYAANSPQRARTEECISNEYVYVKPGRANNRGKPNPRDVERRARQLLQAKNTRKQFRRSEGKKRFNSTLGFPGEGPDSYFDCKYGKKCNRAKHWHVGNGGKSGGKNGSAPPETGAKRRIDKKKRDGSAVKASNWVLCTKSIAQCGSESHSHRRREPREGGEAVKTAGGCSVEHALENVEEEADVFVTVTDEKHHAKPTTEARATKCKTCSNTEHHAAPVKEEKPTKEEVEAAAMEAVEARCVGLLATPDLSKRSSWQTAMRAVLATASLKGLNNDRYNMVSVISTFNNEMKDALMRRWHDGRARAACEFTFKRLVTAMYAFDTRPLQDDSEDIVASVNEYEQTVPHTMLLLTSATQRCLYRIGLGCVVAARAASEEIIKRFAIACIQGAINKKIMWVLSGCLALRFGGRIDSVLHSAAGMAERGGSIYARTLVSAALGWMEGTMSNGGAAPGRAHWLLRTIAHYYTSKYGVRGYIFHVLYNMYMHSVGAKVLLLDIYAALGVLMTNTDTCLGDHLVKHTKQQPDFRYERSQHVCVEKFGVRAHFSVAGITPIVHRQCTHNETIGMAGRIGKALVIHDSPTANEAVLSAWRALTRDTLPTILQLVKRVWKPMNYTKWAHSFPPTKRDSFLRLRDELYQPPTKPRASAFIKRETTLRKDETFGEIVEKDCRVIQGCPIELSAQCGPFVRKLAKNVRKGLLPEHFSHRSSRMFTPESIASGRQIVYTCGLSGEQIGECFALAIECIQSMCDAGERVVYLEDDQSRFDLHLTEGAFSFLNSVYRRKLPRKISKALERTNVSRGRTITGTKYSVPYTMQSGWPDTSCGDTLVNVGLKYHVHGIGAKWVAIICGDDSVTITTDRLVSSLGGIKGIEKRYKDYGMEVEAQLRLTPLDVEFCSARFMPAKDSWILMPKAGKLLAKLGWDMVDRPVRQRAEWLRGIASTMLSFGRYDPLLAAAGERLHEICGVGPEVTRRSEYERWVSGSGSVDKCNIYDYYLHHYNMSAQDIIECIAVLRKLSLGDVIDNPLVVSMAMHDC